MQAQVNSEDISFLWGSRADPREQMTGRWRLAVFQDMQECLDGSKLYFLYDPLADSKCYTTGGRKGETCVTIFDTRFRCFVGEVGLPVIGRVKFLFTLPAFSPLDGPSFVLCTQSEDKGKIELYFWRVNLNQEGLRPANDPFMLLSEPIPAEEGFIVSMREDKNEIILATSPGLTIYRIKADATYPQDPIDCFSVPGAELSHFYDGFLSMGNMYFMSSSPDGQLDYSRVHILPLESRGPIGTQHCHPDPQKGVPPARKEAAVNSISGFILLAGGELQTETGQVVRLTDYWVLDLTTFRWNRVNSEMRLALIEPVLTTTHSGTVYLWGDFDEPVNCSSVAESGTHLRILKVTGFNLRAPPPYDQSVLYTPQPAYYGGMPLTEGSPQTVPASSPAVSPYMNTPQPVPPGCPGMSGGPNIPYGMQPNANLGTDMGGPQYQYPHYPPKDKKKDCVIT